MFCHGLPQLSTNIKFHLILGSHKITPSPLVANLSSTVVISLPSPIQGSRNPHTHPVIAVFGTKVGRVIPVKQRLRVQFALDEDIQRPFQTISSNFESTSGIHHQTPPIHQIQAGIQSQRDGLSGSKRNLGK